MAKSKSDGLSARLDAAVSNAIAASEVVGTVVMVWQSGQIVYRNAAGYADREAKGAMQLDSIFRLASLTKPLTAATALAMVDQKLLGLDDAVADYLPWFRPRLQDGDEPIIKIRHLLTHTSGLSYANPINTGLLNSNRTLEETLRFVAEQPLGFRPGTKWMYGCSTDVLGAVIAHRHQGTLGDAMAKYVTGPLGMVDTGFGVADPKRLVTAYADGPPGIRRMEDPETVTYPDGGQLSFSPSRILNPNAYHSGGAGAAGTAGDFMQFLVALQNSGEPILRRSTLKQAAQNQIGVLPLDDQPGAQFGFLGQIVCDPVVAGRPVATGSVRWGGVYGNDWLVDFTNQTSIVTLTNTPIAGCDGPFSNSVVKTVYNIS